MSVPATALVSFVTWVHLFLFLPFAGKTGCLMGPTKERI